MNRNIVLVFLAVVIISTYTAAVLNNQNADEITLAMPFSETRSIMGTTVTIKVIDTNETHALESIDRAFDKIYYIDELMSSYKNESQLSILNRQGYLDDANPDFVYVLERSKYYSKISDGAFDVTIKPILDLWSSKYSPGGTYMPPTPDEINETLQLVDYSGITIETGSEGSISLQPNMSVILGGIAKGYAADMAIESLKLDGIENCFVNAGGDGRFIGLNERGAPWNIGLQNPDKSEEAVTRMAISDMAVATSGNYERYFSDEAKVSHISDPRTGYSAQELISATVISDTAMDADALATTIFVLGEDDGINVIEGLDGVECLIITDDRRIIRSSGFDEYEI